MKYYENTSILGDHVMELTASALVEKNGLQFWTPMYGGKTVNALDLVIEEMLDPDTWPNLKVIEISVYRNGRYVKTVKNGERS